MAKAKGKEKKGKRAKLSKVRKRGSQKNKNNKGDTAKARKGGKKKAARRKVTPRPKVIHTETPPPSPSAFTEIASEEMTLSSSAAEKSAMMDPTKPEQASESSFASLESSGNNM